MPDSTLLQHPNYIDNCWKTTLLDYTTISSQFFSYAKTLSDLFLLQISTVKQSLCNQICICNNLY